MYGDRRRGSSRIEIQVPKRHLEKSRMLWESVPAATAPEAKGKCDSLTRRDAQPKLTTWLADSGDLAMRHRPVTAHVRRVWADA